MYSPTPNKMPTRITLTYHAYKDFEVPNKIAKMINDGTISWRSRHDELFYTDENGNEQSVSSIRECVAWEGHDDYEVAESEEESDEESECCECQQHGDDGCRCDCHSEPSDSEEDDCVIPSCCNDAKGCSQCVDEGEPLVEGVDYEVLEEKSESK